MNKSDFEKIGVSVIRVFVSNGRFCFKHKETLYDLAPAQFMNFVLSPLVIGVDKLVQFGCKKKNLCVEQGVNLLFSTEYFPNADVKFNYRNDKADGWIYDIESLNLEVMQGQAAWICPYMKFFYSEPPNCLYLKLEEVVN